MPPDNPYESLRDTPPPVRGPAPSPQPGFGIASLVVGILCLLAYGVLFGFLSSPTDARPILSRFPMLLNVVGTALSIVSRVQSERPRGYAVAGFAINLLTLVVVGVLTLMGPRLFG